MSMDPADVNTGCVVARMQSRTDQTGIVSANFSDFDHDGDGGARGDSDSDGDSTTYTVRPLPRLVGGS